MATTNKPAAPAGAQWNAPTAQPPLDTDSPASLAMAKALPQTSVPSPKVAVPADALGSTSDTGKASASGPRFMMRRSGGGKMTPINKPPSANGTIKYEDKRQSTNGDKHHSSSFDIFKVKSDIGQDDRSASWSFSSASQSYGEKRRKSVEAEGYPNPKRAKDINGTIVVSENSTNGYIPPHLTTTVDGRKYSQFKASNDGLEDTHGAIIPGGYTTIAHLEKPWPCPVIDCMTLFSSLRHLGHHFKEEHRATTFHDNNDGTLVKKGTYGNKSATSYAIVVTQEKPKIYTAGLANAINIALSESRPNAPSVDGVDDDSSHDSEDDGFDIISDDGSSRSLGGKSHVSDDSGESPNGDLVSPGERRTGCLPDLRTVPSREPHTDPATSRSTRQPFATEAPAAVDDAGPAVSPKATGTEVVVKPNNGDFSTPMPSDVDRMWNYVKQFTVVHRTEIPERMYVRDFLSLRRLRDLEWNDAWIASHQFKDSVPRDVSSMIMQITGPYAAEPCTRCKGGYGPYKGCVRMPPDAPPHPQIMIYGCANCTYHGGQTHCSLQAQSKKEAAERFPHLDFSKVRAEVYAAANSAAGRLSAQARQLKARVVREAQKESPKREKPKATPETDESLVLVAAGISAGAEFSTRSRGAKPPNYNIKELSRPSWQRASRRSSAGSGAPTRGALTAEAVTEMAKGPEQVDAGTPMGDVKAQAVAPQARGHPEQPSDRVSTPDKNATVGQDPDSGPIRRGRTTARPDVARAAVPLGSGLGGFLEMDDWEFGPGVLSCGEDGPENVAFSSAYLVGQKLVPVADGVSCRVEFLKPGCSLSLSPDARSTRLCTILAGKVRVQIGDASFGVGFGGNLKIRPGASAVLQNRLYIDAYLQIMSVAELV
ncbi:hypothetical protein RB595_005213 [Gaeumannomyces hyphopodioides]